MKFSTAILLSLLASLTTSAPIEAAPVDAVKREDGIPDAAILASYPIGAGQQPFYAESDGTDYVVIVNTTALDSTYSKRDADADADAKWYWTARNKWQPMKRDADADADAKWYWTARNKWQPMKRDADADADADAKWYWTARNKWQPMKRDADADADADAKWYWTARNKWQPMKRDVASEEVN